MYPFHSLLSKNKNGFQAIVPHLLIPCKLDSFLKFSASDPSQAGYFLTLYQIQKDSWGETAANEVLLCKPEYLSLNPSTPNKPGVVARVCN